MLQRVKRRLRGVLVGAAKPFVGSEPGLHRIPFGPIRNRFLFTSFAISPRMYLGIDEPVVVRWAREHVRSGDVVYDVGAHIGYTSLVFAQLVGPAGAVHAFELLPSTCEKLLRKTVAANAFDNIAVHNVGLGSHARTVELPVSPALMTTLYPARTAGQTMELCRVESLDDYAQAQRLPPPALIKMDVEAAEVECLQGGRRLIEQHRPKLIIEFHRPQLLREGIELLSSLGYTVLSRRNRPLTATSVAGIDRFHQSVLCLPG